MAKILIVEDASRFAEPLTRQLNGGGHLVEQFTCGREAIDFGASFRPDVVVAQWKLGRALYGLEVADALRAIHPGLRAILSTPGGLRPLRDLAERAGIFALLEEPVEIGAMHSVVERAASCTPDATDMSDLSVGIIEVGLDFEIEFANPKARKLLAQTAAGAKVRNLRQVFSHEHMPDFSPNRSEWQEVRPRAAGGGQVDWAMRVKPSRRGAGVVAVIMRSEEIGMTRHPIIKLLFDRCPPAARAWPLEGQALIVDDEDLLARLYAANMNRAGCVCHVSASHACAAKRLDRFPLIDFLLIDYTMPCGSPERLIGRARELNPGITIVGMSGQDRAEEFASLDVDRFLLKPWEFDQLLSIAA